MPEDGAAVGAYRTSNMMDVDGAPAPPVSGAVSSKKRPRPPAHEWGLDPLFWVRT